MGEEFKASDTCNVFIVVNLTNQVWINQSPNTTKLSPSWLIYLLATENCFRYVCHNNIIAGTLVRNTVTLLWVLSSCQGELVLLYNPLLKWVVVCQW